MVAVGVENMICCWQGLLELLPPWLREPMDAGGRDKQVLELRLRLGQMPQAVTGRGEWYPACRRIGAEDLNYVVNVASRYSPYAAVTLAKGYLTARGGHRVGVCGSGVIQAGRLTGFKELHSLCIRVARDIPGFAAGLEQDLGTGSVLLIGPPGSGKTTLLRDLIRRISQVRREQISVVDERGELFPVSGSGFAFSTGDRTDVLTGVGKREGMELVLRSMGPAWIAVDEITALEDCEAMEACGNCGVRFLATAHARNSGELSHRPVYRKLMNSGLFGQLVCLGEDRAFTMERLEKV